MTLAVWLWSSAAEEGHAAGSTHLQTAHRMLPWVTRMLDLIIDQRRLNLGSFEVGRILPSVKRRMVGPFIFFDHLGLVDLPKGLGREADVRPHPHIGLSTVTYVFAGEIMHRDSTGVEQVIRPSEVNWMTAGRGITHSERFEQARREGGPMHAIQCWVALYVQEYEVLPLWQWTHGQRLLYTSSTNTWSETGGMHYARFSHTMTVLTNGQVLVVGGYSHPPQGYLTPLSAAELYTP